MRSTNKNVAFDYVSNISYKNDIFFFLSSPCPSKEKPDALQKRSFCTFFDEKRTFEKKKSAKKNNHACMRKAHDQALCACMHADRQKRSFC